MGIRKAAGALVAAMAATTSLTMTTFSPVAPVAPAGAQADVYLEDIVGNFIGDSREELFTYLSGSFPETMLQFRRLGDGSPGSDADFEVFEFQVNGRYDPVAGDFDGDGFDEILWYAPGPTPDYLWNFTSTSTVSSKAYQANGYYVPIGGDFTGDGVDDVLWYAPGTAQDYIWDYNGGGAGYTSRPRTINGVYVPVAGSFGTNNTDDVLWFAPGARQDFLWDFAPNGSYVSRAYTVGGAYRPFVLDVFADGWRGEDIFWYAPGVAADYLWDYVPGGARNVVPTPVNGDYDPAAGDFFGDGHDDVAWFAETRLGLWDHAPDAGGVVRRWQYSFTGQSEAAAAALPAAGPAGAQADAGRRVPAGAAAAVPGPTLAR